MEMTILAKGRALSVDKGVIWIAQGLSFFGIDQNRNQVTPKYKVRGRVDYLICKSRLLCQLLRLGIHHLLPLKNGGFIVAIKKKTYILDKNGDVVNSFSGYRGNKPAHRGVCVTPDGTIFFGEYTININNDNPTSLYRSTDNGMSFQEIHVFDKKEIRHIHFIQWDDYEKCLWMGTGDKDQECMLMKSMDNGSTWNIVGQASQLWRAVGISFTEDALYWGTDAGSVSDKNYIIRMNRRTYEIQRLQEVQGPCHGNAVLADGTVYVSTGVEGGKNEKDKYAHLWKSDAKGNFHELAKLKKDIFPYILQFGVLRFPVGMDTSLKTVCTAFGLKKYGEVVLSIK